MSCDRFVILLDEYLGNPLSSSTQSDEKKLKVDTQKVAIFIGCVLSVMGTISRVAFR